MALPTRPSSSSGARGGDGRHDSGEIIRLLDHLILRAVEARASDLHLEPRATGVLVRMRVDGVMVAGRPLAQHFFTALVSRIKVLANMDIAEKRMPQDGTFVVRAGGAQLPVAVRASTFPAIAGEKVALRLLIGAKPVTIDRVGLTAPQAAMVDGFVQRPSGLVLVTGPTGSGKTTTLYALLQAIDTARRNVLTLEDPIEVELPGITQGQVDTRTGFTFSEGLRAILRQDPDVIMVGEMRDLDTARIAVQAGLTGHLVVSTLHTSSIAETMTRLVDMGLEPYTVANSLLAVMSQRLVRRVCPDCVIYTLDHTGVSEALGFHIDPDLDLATAPGCPKCLGTGFRGRMGLFEMVEVDDELRGVIKEKCTSGRVKAALRAKQVPTLRRNGLRMVADGSTTWQELCRIT